MGAEFNIGPSMEDLGKQIVRELAASESGYDRARAHSPRQEHGTNHGQVNFWKAGEKGSGVKILFIQDEKP